MQHEGLNPGCVSLDCTLVTTTIGIKPYVAFANQAHPEASHLSLHTHTVHRGLFALGTWWSTGQLGGRVMKCPDPPGACLHPPVSLQMPFFRVPFTPIKCLVGQLLSIGNGTTKTLTVSPPQFHKLQNMKHSSCIHSAPILLPRTLCTLPDPHPLQGSSMASSTRQSNRHNEMSS